MSQNKQLPRINNLLLAHTLPEKKSFSDYLLDDRTLLENELKDILGADKSDFNSERASELVSALLKDFEEDAENISPKTWASIVNNWRIFNNWCDENNYSSLPSTVPVFIKFITDKSVTCKSNSLQVYRWAVKTMHLAAGLPSPTDSIKVKMKMRGIKSSKANNGETISQASPLREIHLNELERLWSKSNRLITLRDLALLTVSYETMLRESELARIEFQHLSFNYDGRCVITIPSTKTNKSGEPDMVMLSNRALATLENYLITGGINLRDVGIALDDENKPVPNYVFKKLLKSGRFDFKFNSPLSGYSIDKIFKNAHETIRANPSIITSAKSWSGHSARVGACQDLLAAGYSPLEVQQSGRWLSINMVYGYGRAILSSETAMAKARKD